MSRISINGNYEGQDFVLRYEESNDIYMTITPNDVFGIGNSIGGYWAKPITYAGQKMIALVRVSGSDRSGDLQTIKKRHGREKGFILRPGKGLWATSSGSAKRGVFHVHRESKDPIVQALRAVKMPRHLLKEVARIDTIVQEGGPWCKHRTADNRHRFFFEVDGETEVVEEAVCVESNSNRYHIGCPDSSTEYSVKGGSFLVEVIEGRRKSVYRVWVTPDADRERVAQIIQELMA